MQDEGANEREQRRNYFPSPEAPSSKFETSLSSLPAEPSAFDRHDATMDVLTWIPRTLLAIGKTGLSFVLPYSLLSPPKGGWGFHHSSAFEGYYARMQALP